ncbi:hypothetical protein AKJ09_06712 [Labilithrix luteola]|uniref:Outer membrane lipoprotein BamD-like domain-containing protein n=1 Tax=Labilithrix luteola TaxID=1391654 RepID=A0A0K1Q2Q5_9BACT|nr:hypothetical protein [Labilithrix luteola]AKV00049.1 hypothetical protein AKJ09_06712 [Labilithrix luteola]
MTEHHPIHDEPSAVDEEIRDVVRGLRANDPAAFDVARGLARFERAVAATPRPTWPLGRLIRLIPMAVLVTAAGTGLYAFEARRAHGGGEAPAPASPVTMTAPSAHEGARVAPTIPPPEAPRSEGASAISVDALPVARSSVTAPPRPVARATTPSPSPTRSVSEREVMQLVELRRVAVTDAAAAVELARAGHAEFPRGRLYPEREAILIDALRQSGHPDEARAHAAQFVERYPTHTVTPRMRSLVDP